MNFAGAQDPTKTSVCRKEGKGRGRGAGESWGEKEMLSYGFRLEAASSRGGETAWRGAALGVTIPRKGKKRGGREFASQGLAIHARREGKKRMPFRATNSRIVDEIWEKRRKGKWCSLGDRLLLPHPSDGEGRGGKKSG